MRITDAAVAMRGESRSTEKYTREERLKIWADTPVSNSRGQKAQNSQTTGMYADVLEISEKAKNMAVKDSECVHEAGNISISPKDKQKMLLLQKLLEALTGKKIKFQVLEELPAGVKDGTNIDRNNTGAAAPQKQGWGLEYDSWESYSEQETVAFNAEGIIKTADGKEININVKMNLSRSFVQQEHIQVRAGDARIVDPLIINFNGSAAELADTTFSFDLDCDGREDQVSAITPGSGFLALDIDGDGKITSGKELFGPQTGNGFNELAQYDEDKNNWIDENDSIYQRLRIWTKNAQGEETLFALGQKGVGAIYLDNVETLFSFKNQSNELKGQLVRSGIFVKESGAAGIVQQINLKV